MKVKFILMLIGLTSLFFAGDIELSLQDVVVIQDSSGLTRILFTFDTSQPIDTSMIDYAELFIPRFLQAEPEYSLTLEARLLTRQWQSLTVSWYYPWETPGADYDTTFCCQFRVSSRIECDICMDISELIKKMYGGSSSNYGILLMTPKYEDNGFTMPIENLIEILNTARIKLAINPAAMNQ